jgi:hypothetical protein
MTTKKMFLGLGLGLGLCSLVAFAPTKANAEVGFCSGVQILQAGAQSTGKFIQALNTRADCGNWPQNTALFFQLDASAGQDSAMLAASLSAQAIGGRILVVALVPDQYSDFGTVSFVTVMTP